MEDRGGVLPLPGWEWQCRFSQSATSVVALGPHITWHPRAGCFIAFRLSSFIRLIHHDLRETCLIRVRSHVYLCFGLVVFWRGPGIREQISPPTKEPKTLQISPKFFSLFISQIINNLPLTIFFHLFHLFCTSMIAVSCGFDWALLTFVIPLNPLTFLRFTSRLPSVFLPISCSLIWAESYFLVESRFSIPLWSWTGESSPLHSTSCESVELLICTKSPW